MVLMTSMILIDLQKAFVMIDHNILLKGEAIVFLVHTIDSLKSYLANQFFRVNLEKHSNLSNITSVIPQGSILQTLLCLICINDMPQAVISNPYLHADDSCHVFQRKIIKKLKKN